MTRSVRGIDRHRRVWEAGRLVFNGGGGDVAGAGNKQCKKKKRAEGDAEEDPSTAISADRSDAAASAGEEAYTIDAAKNMKYEELFSVEAKRFPADKS